MVCLGLYLTVLTRKHQPDGAFLMAYRFMFFRHVAIVLAVSMMSMPVVQVVQAIELDEILQTPTYKKTKLAQKDPRPAYKGAIPSKPTDKGTYSSLSSQSSRRTPLADQLDPAFKSSGTDRFSTKISKPEQLKYNQEVYILDFKTAMQMALRQSLTLASMRSKTETAGYEKLQAISELLPDVSIGYRQSRFQGGIQVFDGNPNLAYITTILPEVKAVLPINLGGQQFFTIKSREKARLVAEQIEQLVTDQHLYYVSSDYLNLLNQHLNLQASHQNLEESKQQLNFSKARFKEGLGVMLDVLEAQNSVDAQTRKLLNTKQEIRAANQRLNAHFGLPSTTTIIPVMDSVTPLRIYNPDELNVSSLVSYSTTRSPRARQAFHRFESAHADFKAVVASLMPTLTLSTYANLVGNRSDNLLESRYAGMEINLNILEGLGVTSYARVKQAQEAMKRSTYEYDQAKRDIEKDITIMANAFMNATETLPLAKNQLLTAEQAKEQAWGRYQNGVGSYLELLQASTALQNARTTYISEQLDFRRKQLELAYNVGDLKQRLVMYGIPELQGILADSQSPYGERLSVGKRPFQALKSSTPEPEIVQKPTVKPASTMSKPITKINKQIPSAPKAPSPMDARYVEDSTLAPSYLPRETAPKPQTFRPTAASKSVSSRDALPPKITRQKALDKLPPGYAVPVSRLPED
jgi:outer membrane protein TolC